MLFRSALYIATGAVTSGRIGSAPALLVGYLEHLVPSVYLQWVAPTSAAGDAVPALMSEWIGVVFWAIVCAAVLATFSGALDDGTRADRTRARSLLAATGGSNLSWMTLWERNNFWFSADGRSYLAYRVIGGIALTTGGPVGPAEDHGAAVQIGRAHV